MHSGLQQMVELLKDIFRGPLPAIAAEFDETVLNSDRFVRGFGYWLLATLFAGFFLWASLAPIESAALGQGTVQVEGNRKSLQHYEGGIVSEILVTSGDYVTEGQLLVRLDATQAQAEQRIIEGRVWAKRALVDRLISERDDAREATFDDTLLKQKDERARIAVANESALFEARRADRLGEIEVLNQRITQLQMIIEGTSSVIQAKEDIVGSLKAERSELNELLTEGYVDKQRIRELDRSLAQTLGDLSELYAKVASANVSVEEAHLNILQLNKRFKTQVVDALSGAQEELYDMEQRLVAINHRLRRTLINAPATGYILGLKPNVEGAVIAPGEEILQIVPDFEKLVIDTRLSPMDIDRIRVGQEAEVRFSVFKDAYLISGSLVRVSADSLIDNVTGESYFEAKVELSDQDLNLLGEYELVPGMPAQVSVKTGNRTFLGYLTSPLQRMFDRSLTED